MEAYLDRLSRAGDHGRPDRAEVGKACRGQRAGAMTLGSSGGGSSGVSDIMKSVFREINLAAAHRTAWRRGYSNAGRGRCTRRGIQGEGHEPTVSPSQSDNRRPKSIPTFLPKQGSNERHLSGWPPGMRL